MIEWVRYKKNEGVPIIRVTGHSLIHMHNMKIKNIL